MRALRKFTSTDGTVRYLFGLEDGRTVESVFLPEAYRDTFCLSSQVGCAVDCQFCLTAKMGLERNLSAEEIAGQARFLLAQRNTSQLAKPVNVVLMGQGEPLLNLDAVLEAYRLMTDQRGMAIAPRRICLSTSGIVPKLVELGQHRHRPRLAISLNASTQEQREAIMPITRKYRLADLIAACREFPLKKGERIFFEYVLLAGVNDADDDARRVVELLRGIPAVVNLLPWNAGPGLPFSRPSEERTASFHAIVARDMLCYVRKTRGEDVLAACGQLKLVELEAVGTPGV
ncbi:MAG: 23S rRNA (adenine(2503)-C(2))-methyltransferase RlmN [Bryobacter sp.]|nr:23S rRNA (adenine(2503)-C(2))-methyltransferase RlmN [Bryobacter sp.]